MIGMPNKLTPVRELQYRAEIKRLFQLLSEADAMLGSLTMPTLYTTPGEQYSDDKAKRWLERASILSPLVKDICFDRTGKPLDEKQT